MRRRRALALVSTLILLAPAAGFVVHLRGTDPAAQSGALRVEPSAPVRFFKSEQGRRYLRARNTRPARAILSWLGEDPSSLPHSKVTTSHTSTQPHATTSDAGTLSTSCGTSYGIKFNREPPEFGLPQNEEAIDFLYNRVAAGVDLIVGGANDFGDRLPDSFMGYYVNRDADCSAEYEGGTPPIDDPLEASTQIFGGGDPVVVADPGRNAFFLADLRLDETTTGIGVMRSLSTTLLNTTSCPDGTHSTSQSGNCWPTRRLVLARPTVSPPDDIVDKPHMGVDERTSGTGSGQVYVVATDFAAAGTSSISLAVCNNALTTCTSPMTVSGGDTVAHFAHVSVRPSGAISISWTNLVDAGGVPAAQIRYRACAAATVPSQPACDPVRTVFTDTQPIVYSGVGGSLGAQHFRIETYPKHDHRRDANGVETYIVWDHCKKPLIDLFVSFVCPDADVVMAASTNNGVSWSAPAGVNTGLDDQFFPWIRTDRSRNVVNIVYYNSNPDPTFQHRVRVELKHINPGGATPDPITDTHVITTLLNEPDADILVSAFGGVFFQPEFGDYIGVAARGNGADGGSRAYPHFTYNNYQATYNGASVPNSNNHLSRLNY